MSDSKAKYIVMVEGEGFEPHICGVFMELKFAVKCIADEHVDTGLGLDHYKIECWRGRQFNGTYNGDGKLTEVARASANE